MARKNVMNKLVKGAIVGGKGFLVSLATMVVAIPLWYVKGLLAGLNAMLNFVLMLLGWFLYFAIWGIVAKWFWKWK